MTRLLTVFICLGFQKISRPPDVGVRATFYRIAMIATQGGLVIFEGFSKEAVMIFPPPGLLHSFWRLASLRASSFIIISFFPILRRTIQQVAPLQHLSFENSSTSSFFSSKKKASLPFLLLFLLPARRDQLLKIIAPFLLDSRPKGGLGLTTYEVGITYGTVGVIALMLGGLLGWRCDLQKRAQVLYLDHGLRYASAECRFCLSLAGDA